MDQATARDSGPRSRPVLSRNAALSRTLGCLYTAGAVVALLWTALPHEADGGDDVAVVMALLALVALSAGFMIGGGSQPDWRPLERPPFLGPGS